MTSKTIAKLGIVNSLVLLLAILFNARYEVNSYSTIRIASYADTVYESLQKSGKVDELMIVRAAQKRDEYDAIIAAVESLVKANKLVELEPIHSWNGTEIRRWEVRR